MVGLIAQSAECFVHIEEVPGSSPGEPTNMKIVSLEKLKDEPLSHSPKIKKRVLLKKGEVPHLTSFSQATFKPGQIASEHVHEDMYEVYLVQGGTGLIKVDGKVHQLKKATA